MNNGGNDPLLRHPRAEAIPEGTLVPTDAALVLGQALSPEIDGEKLAMLEFTCVELGRGENQEPQQVRILFSRPMLLGFLVAINDEAVKAMRDGML